MAGFDFHPLLLERLIGRECLFLGIKRRPDVDVVVSELKAMNAPCVPGYLHVALESICYE